MQILASDSFCIAETNRGVYASNHGNKTNHNALDLHATDSHLRIATATRHSSPGGVHERCSVLQYGKSGAPAQFDAPRSRSRRRLQREEEVCDGVPLEKVLLVSDPIFDTTTTNTAETTTKAAKGSMCGLMQDTLSEGISSPFSSTRSEEVRDSSPIASQVPCKRLSKCKRMLQDLRQPAFDLEEIERSRSIFIAEAKGCNAAKCYPLSKITDTVYIGTWRDASDAELLKALNIEYILNVAKELELPREKVMDYAKQGIECHSIPMVDSHYQDLNKYIYEAFTFINKAKENYGRVLVYCRRGISRSATIVIAYLMVTEGLGYKDALEFVLERRSCVSLNMSFHEKLSEFQEDSEWYLKWRERGAAAAERKDSFPRVDSECQQGISLSSTNSLDLKLYEERYESEFKNRSDRQFSFTDLCVGQSTKDCFVNFVGRQKET